MYIVHKFYICYLLHLLNTKQMPNKSLLPLTVLFFSCVPFKGIYKTSVWIIMTSVYIFMQRNQNGFKKTLFFFFYFWWYSSKNRVNYMLKLNWKKKKNRNRYDYYVHAALRNHRLSHLHSSMHLSFGIMSQISKNLRRTLTNCEYVNLQSWNYKSYLIMLTIIADFPFFFIVLYVCTCTYVYVLVHVLVAMQ